MFSDTDNIVMKLTWSSTWPGVQVSIEDITTRHGAHHELLNYEIQRWELGRWVTVAKHGHK